MARYSDDSIFNSAVGGARQNQPLGRDEDLDGTTAADLIDPDVGVQPIDPE